MAAKVIIPDAGGVYYAEDGTASVVLEDNFDENYVPSEKEVLEYAQWLGMDPEDHGDLMWIAREGLKAPLPDNWRPCKTDTGEIYYFNFASGESLWDHPMDEYYKDLFAKEKAKLDERRKNEGKGKASGGADKAERKDSKTEGGGGKGKKNSEAKKEAAKDTDGPGPARSGGAGGIGLRGLKSLKPGGGLPNLAETDGALASILSSQKSTLQSKLSATTAAAPAPAPAPLTLGLGALKKADPLLAAKSVLGAPSSTLSRESEPAVDLEKEKEKFQKDLSTKQKELQEQFDAELEKFRAELEKKKQATIKDLEQQTEEDIASEKKHLDAKFVKAKTEMERELDRQKVELTKQINEKSKDLQTELQKSLDAKRKEKDAQLEEELGELDKKLTSKLDEETRKREEKIRTEWSDKLKQFTTDNEKDFARRKEQIESETRQRLREWEEQQTKIIRERHEAELQTAKKRLEDESEYELQRLKKNYESQVQTLKETEEANIKRLRERISTEASEVSKPRSASTTSSVDLNAETQKLESQLLAELDKVRAEFELKRQAKLKELAEANDKTLVTDRQRYERELASARSAMERDFDRQKSDMVQRSIELNSEADFRKSLDDRKRDKEAKFDHELAELDAKLKNRLDDEMAKREEKIRMEWKEKLNHFEARQEAEFQSSKKRLEEENEEDLAQLKQSFETKVKTLKDTEEANLQRLRDRYAAEAAAVTIEDSKRIATEHVDAELKAFRESLERKKTEKMTELESATTAAIERCEADEARRVASAKNDIEQRYKEQLSSFTAEADANHARAKETLFTKHKRDLDEAERQLRSKLDEENRKREDRLKAEWNDKLKQFEAQQEAELQRLKRSYEAKIQALKETEEANIKRLRERFAAEAAAVTIEDSKRVASEHLDAELKAYREDLDRRKADRIKESEALNKAAIDRYEADEARRLASAKTDLEWKYKDQLAAFTSELETVQSRAKETLRNKHKREMDELEQQLKSKLEEENRKREEKVRQESKSSLREFEEKQQTELQMAKKKLEAETEAELQRLRKFYENKVLALKEAEEENLNRLRERFTSEGAAKRKGPEMQPGPSHSDVDDILLSSGTMPSSASKVKPEPKAKGSKKQPQTKERKDAGDNAKRIGAKQLPVDPHRMVPVCSNMASRQKTEDETDDFGGLNDSSEAPGMESDALFDLPTGGAGGRWTRERLRLEYDRVVSAKSFLRKQKQEIQHRQHILERARADWQLDVLRAKQSPHYSSQRSVLAKVHGVLEKQAKGLNADAILLQQSERWLKLREKKIKLILQHLDIGGDLGADLGLYDVDDTASSVMNVIQHAEKHIRTSHPTPHNPTGLCTNCGSPSRMRPPFGGVPMQAFDEVPPQLAAFQRLSAKGTDAVQLAKILQGIERKVDDLTSQFAQIKRKPIGWVEGMASSSDPWLQPPFSTFATSGGGGSSGRPLSPARVTPIEEAGGESRDLLHRWKGWMELSSRASDPNAFREPGMVEFGEKFFRWLDETTHNLAKVRPIPAASQLSSEPVRQVPDRI